MRHAMAGALFTAALLPTVLAAQSARAAEILHPTPMALSAADRTRHVTLPANTPIPLTADDTVSSARMRKGSRFSLSVASDIMANGTVLIPAGSRAEAELTWRTGRGAFGKSGKMEFDLVSLDVAGTPLPLSGHYRVEGHGDTLGMVATIVLVGWPGVFVTGHSAQVHAGTEYRALTRAPLTFALSAPVQQTRTTGADVPEPRAIRTVLVQPYPGTSNGIDDAIEIPL